MRKIFKTFVIYPIMFGILPVFVLYTGNVYNLKFQMTYRSMIVLFCYTAILLILMRLALKNWHKAGLLVTFFNLFFVNFFQITRLLNNLLSIIHVYKTQIAVAFEGSIMIIGFWIILRIFRKPQAFTFPLNFISICMIFMNLAFIGISALNQQLLKSFAQEKEVAYPINFETQPVHETKRDIYYIILDGYTRSDILQELYGFNNRDFLDHLSAEGFYIADKSQSNYSQTILSICSSLNMQYLDKLLDLDPKSNNRVPLMNLIKNSQVRKFLEDQEYRIVAFDSGFDGTNIDDADIFIERKNKINLFEFYLINNSLATFGLDTFSIPFQYTGMKEQFTKFGEVVNLTGPKFVFAHFVIPHPPFLFDRNGNLREGVSGSIGDGSHFKGSKEDYQKGYMEQVLYVNQRIEGLVDNILLSQYPKPIIVIQGDHGSGLYLDQDFVANTCTRERLSILNAYYFPDVADADLYQDITPVNSFRVILNTYFDENLPLLEDLSYYSPMSLPFDFQEVFKGQLSQSCETGQSSH